MSIDPSDKSGAGVFVEAATRLGRPVVKEHCKVSDEVAARCMDDVVRAICTELAREVVYIPAAFDARNSEIVRKWNEPYLGAAACSKDRVKQLAREYALSSRQVYSVISKRRQLGMLGAPNPKGPGDGLPGSGGVDDRASEVGNPESPTGVCDVERAET